MSEEFPQPPARIVKNPEELLEIKKEYLERLRRLRFDFLDEIPPERLLPEAPNYHLYKCRTNFFGTVSASIQRFQDLGLIKSLEVIRECEEFFKFCDSIRGTGKFYIKEDIDKVNRVLDLLIKELS